MCVIGSGGMFDKSGRNGIWCKWC